jgi:hypothetical protein
MRVELLGLNFPERRCPACRVCGGPMTFTRWSNLGALQKVRIFECFECRYELVEPEKQS